MKTLCAQLVTALFCSVPALAIAGEAVLIEFTSTRCAPCQQMKPVLSELARSGVAIRSVDVDREPELTRRYGIQQTPTFIVVSNGKELTRLVGRQAIDELQAALSINPNGPWVNTNSSALATDAWAADAPPPTRLAPLPTSLVPPAQMPSPHAITGEPMPSLSVADAVQRAQAATVRLRVHDGTGHGAGTGTIVDAQGEEALVLTCGHLFRDTQGKGRIEVDLFVGGETRTVEGQLIDYDADNRDIAIVAIRPGIVVQPVKVVGPNNLPVAGDAAFSFGCDRGADPSRRDTRITGVNKYNQDRGGSNLEIAGAPIDGRSGGGLFDTAGRLIGVCNAADYEGDIGIYAGPGSVHWQLDRAQLSKLYQDDQPVRMASLNAPIPANEIAANPTLAQPVVPASAEVIVIIRDPSNRDAAPRVMTLTEPPPELLQMIESSSLR